MKKYIQLLANEMFEYITGLDCLFDEPRYVQFQWENETDEALDTFEAIMLSHLKLAENQGFHDIAKKYQDIIDEYIEITNELKSRIGGDKDY
jgi:hypothetical protein